MKDFLSIVYGSHGLDKLSRTFYSALLFSVAIICGCFAYTVIENPDGMVRSSGTQLALIYALLFSAASLLTTRHLFKAVLFHLAFAALQVLLIYLLGLRQAINIPAALMYIISTIMNGLIGLVYLFILIIGVLVYRGVYRLIDTIDRSYRIRRQTA